MTYDEYLEIIKKINKNAFSKLPFSKKVSVIRYIDGITVEIQKSKSSGYTPKFSHEEVEYEELVNALKVICNILDIEFESKEVF